MAVVGRFSLTSAPILGSYTVTFDPAGDATLEYEDWGVTALDSVIFAECAATDEGLDMTSADPLPVYSEDLDVARPVGGRVFTL